MNPVYEAYKILVDYRDNGDDLDIDAAIGFLGEALDDHPDNERGVDCADV